MAASCFKIQALGTLYVFISVLMTHGNCSQTLLHTTPYSPLRTSLPNPNTSFSYYFPQQTNWTTSQYSPYVLYYARHCIIAINHVVIIAPSLSLHPVIATLQMTFLTFVLLLYS